MKRTTSISKDFTKGNIVWQLLMFTLPFMASNALQVLYSTIDMVIVGKYVGTPGLSAVSQSSQILSFATMVCLGFSNAGQVLISQALGAGKRKEINEIIGTLFGMILGMGLFLSCVILLARQWIMSVMNIPAESWEMAADYMIICGGGLVFTAGYNMVSAALRGMGDSRRPFLFIGIASFVNLILDILFTGMLGFGVAGAAWATIIGQAVSFLFSIYYLYRSREAFGFDFRRKSFIPRKKYVKMIAELGTPMAIQSGCINLSMLFVNAMVNNVGVVASATFGVGVRIDDIINKISQGLQFAAMPMISQNIAAGERKRSRQVVWFVWLFAFVLMAFFIAVYYVFGRQLFMLFSDDTKVHDMSATFIRAILWMFPAMSIMRGSNAFIQGIGNAKLSMVLALLDGVVLRIGLSWLFGIVLDWGFFGFVLGYGLAPYGCAVPGMIYFLSGVWQRRKVLAEDI
ncbi:MAG: MATE family efflux transporter [Lachnospiraceae bacterium]|jgi:putative MATE family efflux protein|nr:MATE family efflux transporter [Lachnospiraceae bacterium]MDE7002777.1 MATE family efflux transporter [Lachnospiraceae bacterium]